jgi:cytochrome oxidase assembly protein ShyY1
MRRWGGYLALTMVFAIACGLLSWWQWSRRAEAVERIDRIEANYDAPARALTDLLPGLDDVAEEAEWHPVALRGEYLADEQLLVRNRPRNGLAGYEVLVPLQLDDGRVFVVDRGWVPAGDDLEAPRAVPAPPPGEVVVVARLRSGEPEISGRSAPEGQLATIHLPSVVGLVDAPVYSGMYGLVVSEDPAPGEAPLPAFRPSLDEGSHLSYALQWIAFGVLAFVGLAWAVRRERALAAGASPVRRRERDAEIEDELVDRQRVDV